MSDEAREAKATADENQNRLGPQEEQITKPAPKVKPQREKDPKKVAAGKKLAEKNRQAKAALEREVKREREIAEREQENENSAGWLPEMSFQTVLSIVGIAFTAFEMYQRFRPKVSSGSAQSPIYSITAEAKPGPSSEPRAEPKHSGALSEAPTRVAERSETREAPSVQKSEWCERSGAGHRARTKGL